VHLHLQEVSVHGLALATIYAEIRELAHAIVAKYR